MNTIIYTRKETKQNSNNSPTPITTLDQLNQFKQKHGSTWRSMLYATQTPLSYSILKQHCLKYIADILFHYSFPENILEDIIQNFKISKASWNSISTHNLSNSFKSKYKNNITTTYTPKNT